MKGCFTAMVTPFKDGAVDYESFEKMIDFQAKSGVAGIVPCGTTGESPTLSHQEHDAVIEFAIKHAKGRLKVIAGTGSNSTEECLRLSRHADEAGADGVLLVSPYYNKPTQEGLYQHYRKVAEAVACEIVVYNIPGRTSVTIQLETFKRLAELKNFNTVKEATGDVHFASNLQAALPEIDILSGDDGLNLPLASIGCVGSISVLANLFPAQTKQVFTYHEQGEVKKAAQLHYQLNPLVTSLFLETNPIPIKMACFLEGLISTPEVRLPLVPASAAVKTRLETELKKLKAVLA